MGIEWVRAIRRILLSSSCYGFLSIPQTILIAPNGEIISRDLKGEAVREPISPLYK